MLKCVAAIAVIYAAMGGVIWCIITSAPLDVIAPILAP